VCLEVIVCLCVHLCRVPMRYAANKKRLFERYDVTSITVKRCWVKCPAHRRLVPALLSHEDEFNREWKSISKEYIAECDMAIESGRIMLEHLS